MKRILLLSLATATLGIFSACAQNQTAAASAAPVVPVASAAPARPAIKRIILIGYGPFAGRAQNASWQAVKQFAGQRPVSSFEQTVVWFQPQRTLAYLSAELNEPCIIVGLGEADRDFRVELTAFNERGNYPDVAGNKPDPLKIAAAGPAQLEVTGPGELIQQKLAARGWPARISHDAGRYLCNEMLYELLQAQKGNPHIAGVFFIHVPVLNRPVPGPDGKLVKADAAYMERFGRDLAAVLQEIFSLAGADGRP